MALQPEGHVAMACRGAGAISNSEVGTVERASRRPWAVSTKVARVATSYSGAPGIVREGKANTFLAVTDCVIGHFLHCAPPLCQA